MSIGLLGNMNNNNFSVMRYFRDLGADAELVLFKDDASGSLNHFAPEDDTWEIDKWKPYIRNVDFYCNWKAFYPSLSDLSLPTFGNAIIKEFEKYDKLIGSGLTPALLSKGNIQLDIFYPYATGLEYVGTRPLRKLLDKKLSPKNYLYRYIRAKQIKGLKKTRICLNAEMGLTKQTFNEIGVSFLNHQIPMVYNNYLFKKDKLDSTLIDMANHINTHELKIFSHARHLWLNNGSYTTNEWRKRSKNNHWLIKGFYKLISENNIKPLLILCNYGKDVNASKKLINDLGLDDYVMWLPKMSRKKIMYLLSIVDIGVGQFSIEDGTIWGGTGWEVLASGKPLLQSFNFSHDEYVDYFGHTPPPICDVKSIDDIASHLQKFMDDKNFYHEIASKSKEWFDTYNGIGLARKWLNLLQSS